MKLGIELRDIPTERERIQHHVLIALEHLIDYYMDQKLYQRGIPWAQLLTQL